MSMINGLLYWSKIVGSPQKNKFNPENPQWSFDLSVTDEVAEGLIQKGMKKSYLRNKDDERGTFISFSRDSVKKDGTEGKPFRVVDSQNNPWPLDKLIGNGSEANVVVTLNERTYRGETFLKPSAVAIQIWQLVEYQGKGFPTRANEDGDSDGVLPSAKTGTDNW